MNAKLPTDPPSDEKSIPDRIHITPVPIGYRAEVIYPGKVEWAYVGDYPSENLARQRAEDQLRAEEAMQEARRFMKGSAA